MLYVWNLLSQLNKNHSAATEPLLQIFLRKAVDFRSDNELGKLLACGCTDVFESLLFHSKLQDLWNALGYVLGHLEEKGDPEH